MSNIWYNKLCISTFLCNYINNGIITRFTRILLTDANQSLPGAILLRYCKIIETAFFLTDDCVSII